MRGLLAHIETITGSAAPTCPWRVFYDPLVSEVVAVSTLARERAAQLTGDDPGVLWDGLRVYYAARNATEAHNTKEERKQRETEAKQRAAARKG